LIGGRRGNTAPLVAALVPAGALLGDAIAGLLDCDEQRRAATATEEAVRGGVGTTTTWASETRPGVSGSSTVTAAAASTDGDPCLTVTDVVIVDGQETRAPKRMCRRPPTNRYVRV
jgi:surface antigen